MRVAEIRPEVDLAIGERLTGADTFTPEGLADLEAMILDRIAPRLGDLLCYFGSGELVENLGVASEGLRVYVDVSVFQGRVGAFETVFSWVTVAGLMDMRQRFLARRAVHAERCSAQGEELTPADQPGLPEQ